MSTATLPRAMSGEWIKIRSVRSTQWTLAAFAAISIGIGALISLAVSNQWATMDAADKTRFEGTAASLQGIILGQLVIGVLGVLAVTAEYSSGTIRATLAAVPRRITTLSAKALVFAALAAVAATATSFASYFLAQSLLQSTGASTSITDHGVLRAVFGAAAYLVCVGLLSLGIGTIVRSTAGGITTVVGLLFILPLVANFLPGSWSMSVGKWLPLSLGHTLITLAPEPGALSAGMAAGMMVVYAAVALTVGGFLLARRDA